MLVHDVNLESAALVQIHALKRSKNVHPSSSTTPDDVSSDDRHGMTTEMISGICKEKGFYRTPELNESLYLHFRGFPRIIRKAIAPFVNCRVLWLENNAIASMDGIQDLVHLDTLYLHHNCLVSFAVPVDEQQAGTERTSGATETSIIDATKKGWSMPNLRQLNVSYNRLQDLAGVSSRFPRLAKLIAAHNTISSVCGEELLRLSETLSVLDLSHNKIALAEDDVYFAPTSCTLVAATVIDEDNAASRSAAAGGDTQPNTSSPAGEVDGLEEDLEVQGQPTAAIALTISTDIEAVASDLLRLAAFVPPLKAIAACTKMASLMLHGNEMIRQQKHYRKRVIAGMPHLKYLDEYPVFDDERRTAVAFVRGGQANERAERQSIRDEQEAARRGNIRAFDALMATAQENTSAAASGIDRFAATAYFHQNTFTSTSPASSALLDRSSSTAGLSASNNSDLIASNRNILSHHVDPASSPPADNFDDVFVC